MRWERDKTGEALYGTGGEYLGCVYDRVRDGRLGLEWRALDADFRVVGDVVRTVHQQDARVGAKLMLEAHLTESGGPLPSAEMLLRRL